MNSNSRVLEGPIGTRFAASPQVRPAPGTAAFRAALAQASGAPATAEDFTFPAGQAPHVVKSGDTLYGIARARLAALGQPATPAATMHYARLIAHVNQIRNPDRIYPGQQLAFAPVAAPTEPKDAASDLAGTPSTRVAGAVIPILPEDASAHDVVVVDADDHAVLPLAPDLVTNATRGVAAEDDLRSNPSTVTAARRDLSLYQQIAPPPASAKPPIELPDVVYKGIIGKALDRVPIEPSTRTGLQQANAILSGSFAGRTIAALTGFGGPLLTVAGLVWGIFSAQKISAMQAEAPRQLAQTTSDQIIR